MAEVNSKTRKAGLRFADRLSELAASAPDVYSEHSVHELAKTIRKRFTYSRELRKREILTHLKKHGDGGMSIREISRASQYMRTTVLSCINELRADGLVEFRKIAPAGRGRGRPTERVFPINSP